MQTTIGRTVTRGLLWTSVIVIFIAGSLFVASCQEKQEPSRAPEIARSAATQELPSETARTPVIMTDNSVVEENQLAVDVVPESPEETAIEPADENLTPAGPLMYEVAAGDNLWSISRTFYHTHAYWKLLGESNGIEDPTLLKAGQELRIPSVSDFPYRLYVVREGDNLFGVSRIFYDSDRYSEELAEANDLANVNRIDAGMILRIPHLEETVERAPADSTLLASE